jgi:epoxyqueuosine reductase
MNDLVKITLTESIKAEALRLGFSACGIAKADYLEPEARYLEHWLNQNQHGEMGYMANHFDKRVDPRKLVEGAKSVISLSYNYFTTQKQTDPTAPKLAMYAYGKDYHIVIKENLEELLTFIKQQAGDVQGRCFVDSAPVLEKAWARRSGLGWIGKNTNLLTKRQGSYFFLAELIIDLELEYDGPTKDYCGTCTKCIDACPTQAIFEPYKVDASKCISYFTIELKSELLPSSYKGQFENWMYGCDICQQVCPINSQSTPHNEPQFNASEELLGMSKQEWEMLSEERFRKLFKNSAVKRTKYSGLMRNIDFLK